MYTHVVSTRLDLQWHAPHPPISLFDPRAVAIPEGVHAALSASVSAALSTALSTAVSASVRASVRAQHRFFFLFVLCVRWAYFRRTQTLINIRRIFFKKVGIEIPVGSIIRFCNLLWLRANTESPA